MSKPRLISGVVVLACTAGALQLVGLASATPLASSPSTGQGQGRGQGQGQRGPAQMRFEGMDRNGDGTITRDEWRGSARSFQVHDWNDDGRLSGDEVRVDRRQSEEFEAADHTPTRSERFMEWTERGFASLDHDRNRRITSNEWHYDRETFLRADRNRDGALDAGEFIGSDMDDDRGDSFDDLDQNRDGRVDRDEWHASADAFIWLDRNRDGVLSRTEVVGADDRSQAAPDQFASLDMNADGRIAQDEWHWSAGSFAQRDLNRDGWLTRREFAATANESTSATGNGTSVTVDARQRWTDTGLDVRQGDVLSVVSRGDIQMSGDANDTATPGGSRTGRGAQQAPVNAVAGALIARIGDGAPFVVGDETTITAPSGGRLQFGVNDDHLDDNRGQFDVRITMQPRRNPRR